MRLLIDANLSPRIARGLHDAGLDATHVADVDLLPAIESDLDRGAIASLSPTRLTLRDLPLRRPRRAIGPARTAGLQHTELARSGHRAS
jgi:hypothetical protein